MHVPCMSISATDSCRMQLLFPDQLFMLARMWVCRLLPSAARGSRRSHVSSPAVDLGQATSAAALPVTDALQKPAHSDYNNLARPRKGCLLPASGSQSGGLNASCIHPASCSRVQEQADPMPLFSGMSCVVFAEHLFSSSATSVCHCCCSALAIRCWLICCLGR